MPAQGDHFLGRIELRHQAGTPAVTVDPVGLVLKGDRGYEFGARWVLPGQQTWTE